MTTSEQLIDALRAGVATIICGGPDQKTGSTEPWPTGSVRSDKKFNEPTLKAIRNAMNGTVQPEPKLPYIQEVPVREPLGGPLMGYILCDEEGKWRVPKNGLASHVLGKYVAGGSLNGTILLVPVGYMHYEEESD